VTTAIRENHEYELKYDDNGNLINDGVNVYKYNAENKLIQLNDCILNYDHFGNLNEIKCSKISSTFINDPFGFNGFDIIKELRSDGNNISYLNVHTQNLFGFNLNNENFYYFFDNDFNVINIVNRNMLVNSYEYDPFGVLTKSNENIFNRFKYSGQVGIFELPNDNYLIRARVYRPSLGRFTSLDPAGRYGSLFNAYVYSNNNPLMFRDRNGKWVQVMALGAFAGAVTNTVIYGITSAIDPSSASWGGLAGAALSGAIGGISVVSGGPAFAVLTGSIGGAAGEYVMQSIDKPNEAHDYGDILVNGLLGGASAFLGSKIPNKFYGIPKNPGYYDEYWKVNLIKSLHSKNVFENRPLQSI